MNYIQCESQEEALEQASETKGFAFVTSDHRVHKSVIFCDELCSGVLTAKDFNAYFQFKMQMDCFDGKMTEMSFNDLVRAATDCQKAWGECMKYFKKEK